MNPLKTGWNLILEGILEQNQDSQLLGENHQAIYCSLDELKSNLQQFSQYRHHLNRRLESIKREVESLQLRALSAKGSERSTIDHALSKLEEEGYALQLELEGLEYRLKKIRTMEREKSPNHSDQTA
jgi:regulator of replication initiation timing